MKPLSDLIDLDNDATTEGSSEQRRGLDVEPGGALTGAPPGQTERDELACAYDRAWQAALAAATTHRSSFTASASSPCPTGGRASTCSTREPA